MKYLKVYELYNYEELKELPDVYNGNLYLYNEEPVEFDELPDNISVKPVNRADASDNNSNYIYRIKVKNPLYKRESSFMFFYDDYDDTDDKSNYSGYIYKNSINGEILASIEKEDIIEFKHIGGFSKYDKYKSTKLNVKVSDETDSWLYKYISGSLILPELTDDIINELKKFRPEKGMKIFKGIEEVQINHQSYENIDHYKNGQIINAHIPHPSSWSTNPLLARRFIDDYPSSTPYLVTMDVNIDDILVDVEMLPDRYYHSNQREIILLPGDYKYKILWKGK